MDGELTEEYIDSLDDSDTYRLYVRMKQANPKEFNKQYQQIRFGINIQYDIYNYLEGKYQTKNKEDTIIIEGNQYSLKEFRTETENRIALAKNTIIENIKEKDIYKARIPKQKV